MFIQNYYKNLWIKTDKIISVGYVKKLDFIFEIFVTTNENSYLVDSVRTKEEAESNLVKCLYKLSS